MFPDDIVQAYQDLGVEMAVPVHWSMFDLIQISMPQIGELFSIRPNLAKDSLIWPNPEATILKYPSKT
jgi:hypothetical protein